MEQREWWTRRMKRLQCKAQHHRGILADRVEHHRSLALGDDFPENMNALGFKPLEMCKAPAFHPGC